MNYFYDDVSKSFDILPDILNKIKTLKSEVKESGYYEYMVTWSVVDDAEEVWKTMQFLSMTADFTDELIEKYNLTEKKYLINLLRSLYLDSDPDEKEVIMGYKRPFGNSHVLGDVREELEFLGIVKPLNDDDYDDYEYKLEDEILKEFSYFIVDFFGGGFKVKWYSFDKVYKSRLGSGDNEYWINLGIDRVHSYLSDWTFSKSEFREMQIDKLLDGTL